MREMCSDRHDAFHFLEPLFFGNVTMLRALFRDLFNCFSARAAWSRFTSRLLRVCFVVASSTSMAASVLVFSLEVETSGSMEQI